MASAINKIPEEVQLLIWNGIEGLTTQRPSCQVLRNHLERCEPERTGFLFCNHAFFVSAAISTRLTASHPNSEVKLVRAGVVLRWGTTREGPVLRFLFCFAQAFFLLRKIGFILHLPWPFLSFLVTQPCRLAREDNESDLMVPERQSKLVRQNVSKAESNSCDCSSPTDLKSAPRTVQDHADLSSNPAHRAQDPGRGRDWSAGLHCKLCTQVRI